MDWNAGTFRIGEHVSYYSKSMQKWIGAKVTAVGERGVQLSVKPDVWIEFGNPSVRPNGPAGSVWSKE